MNPWLVQYRREIWRLTQQNRLSVARMRQARRDVLLAIYAEHGARFTPTRSFACNVILKLDGNAYWRDLQNEAIAARIRKLEGKG